MTIQPTVKWAQRKDRLFLTVDVPDIADEVVALTADKVVITGKSGGKDYAVEIEFAGEVDPEDEVSGERERERLLSPTAALFRALLSGLFVADFVALSLAVSRTASGRRPVATFRCRS